MDISAKSASRPRSLFVPHGAPTFALKPGAAGAALVSVAASFTPPRAVVIVSPHWETTATAVGFAERLQTIHDFRGFPPELYRIVYPASGSPGLAQQVLDAISIAGLPVVADANRGLDHGAWVPLRMMYPDAGIPVIPVSVRHDAGAAFHFRLGQALAPLADQGFLIIGSGNVTHNLGDYHVARRAGVTPDYVGDFADWIADRLQAGDVSALLDYRQLAPDAMRAHPAEDHLMPLFVALGAGGGAAAHAERLYSGIDDHVLAMDAYSFSIG